MTAPKIDNPESFPPPETDQTAGSAAPGPSTATRALLIVAAVFFLTLGVVGLALPVLQGVLFLAIGLTLLSLASERTNRALHRLLRRWPRVSARLRLLRGRLRRRLFGAPP